MAEPGILYAALLGQGLVWTTGHCLGMCGPLIVAFRLGGRADGGLSAWRAAGHLLAYQAGRLLVYALAGAAVGLPHYCGISHRVIDRFFSKIHA